MSKHVPETDIKWMMVRVELTNVSQMIINMKKWYDALYYSSVLNLLKSCWILLSGRLSSSHYPPITYSQFSSCDARTFLAYLRGAAVIFCSIPRCSFLAACNLTLFLPSGGGYHPPDGFAQKRKRKWPRASRTSLLHPLRSFWWKNPGVPPKYLNGMVLKLSGHVRNTISLLYKQKPGEIPIFGTF